MWPGHQGSAPVLQADQISIIACTRNVKTLEQVKKNPEWFTCYSAGILAAEKLSSHRYWVFVVVRH